MASALTTMQSKVVEARAAGLTYEEIASALGLSEAAVKWRLRRARRRDPAVALKRLSRPRVAQLSACGDEW